MTCDNINVRTPDLPITIGLLLAVIATVTAALLRWLLDPLLHDQMPFVLFFLAVIVSAWVGGFRSGILATLLGLILSWYFFISPRWSFLVERSEDIVALIVFAIASVAIAALGGSMRKAQKRSHAAEKQAREQNELLRVTLASISDSVLPTVADRSPSPLPLTIAGIGSFEWNIQTGVNRWTPELEVMYGFQPGAFPGTHDAWVKLVHPDDRTRMIRCVEQAVASGEPMQAEWRILRDGGERWILGRFQAFRDESGDPSRLVGVNLDITERKLTEQALRESQKLFETFMLNSPAIAFIKSEDDRLLFVNKAFEQQIWDGRPPDWRNRTGDELWPPAAAKQYRDNDLRILRSGQSEIVEEQVIKADRTETWLSFKFPLQHQGQLCLAGMALNVTERRQIEAQFQHAQKLESLGVLAGGIAHDFNNLLTSVLGYTDLAMLELPANSSALPFLHEAVQGARRAAELTKQMLAYSGKGRFVVEPINLSVLVEDMMRLLQISISKKCVMKFSFMPELPSIEADAAQMRQIIMNLVINASEAIGDRSGVVAVTTGVMHCDRAYLAETYLDEKLAEGLYVYLEVADNGCGMTEETRARIFDPFFTTKFTGRGLGLSAVLGIVRGHRGAIKCYSELGQGTTFKALFPATMMPAKPTDTPTNRGDQWRGQGTVLIIDDEENVRGLAAHMFQRMGFQVLLAVDGREGVEVFRQHREQINLVLLDMTMPHLDGEQTFRELRRIRSDVKTILASGYNEQTATSRFAGKGLAAFIQKPFRYEDLMTLVRKVLA
jgi:PAS domain S-box-containing protein